MFFSVHASTVSDVIPYIKETHGYADVHANKTSFQNRSATSVINAVNVMENTLGLVSIGSWMSENCLKMHDCNNSKRYQQTLRM